MLSSLKEEEIVSAQMQAAGNTSDFICKQFQFHRKETILRFQDLKLAQDLK